MTNYPLWLALAAVFLIGYAAASVRREMTARRRRIRRDMPITDALFHPSHTPSTPEPEPFPIDWHAMRNRKVGR